MRLEQQEITAIKQAIFSYVPAGQCLLYLFGSRADDQKKGGDIDLLLVIKDSASITGDDVKRYKLEMLVDIKSAIGDQKIDLVIAEARELDCDPFLREIMRTAVELCAAKSEIPSN
jgi:predicted nucleotidyltransferase